MKKHILILSFCIIAIISNAQTIKSVGLKIGYCNAKQQWHYEGIDFKRNVAYRPGFYSAVNLELFSRKHLSLVTDIAYCQKGYSEKVLFISSSTPDDGTYHEIGVRHNYISLNPLLKIRKENTHFVPYIIIGPRIDYQVAYRFHDFSFTNPEEFKKFAFGLTGGAGIEYKFKNYGLVLEYQIQYDFTNIVDIKPSDNAAGIYIKNFAMVMAGSFKYYLNN